MPSPKGATTIMVHPDQMKACEQLAIMLSAHTGRLLTRGQCLVEAEKIVRATLSVPSSALSDNNSQATAEQPCLPSVES